MSQAVTQLLPGQIKEALPLTDREALIATLVVDALPIPEIAKALRIGVGTVRNHIKSIYEKTETSRLPELVVLLGRLRG